MKKIVLIAILSVAWLLASPSLNLVDSTWFEVGAPPAIAHDMKPAKKVAKKPLRRVVRSSAPIVLSNAPGFHPMQPITAPGISIVTGTVTAAPAVPGYPGVPTVAILPRGSTAGAGLETSQDRIARCTHQAGLGGLPTSQYGSYIHACAMR